MCYNNHDSKAITHRGKSGLSDIAYSKCALIDKSNMLKGVENFEYRFNEDYVRNSCG